MRTVEVYYAAYGESNAIDDGPCGDAERPQTAVAADGQVTLGDTVMKHGAKKLRRLSDGNVVAGFAGTTADAQALFTRFEAKLQEFQGNLERAAVELAKDWRTDRALRRLDALLVVADKGARLASLG